MTRPLPFLAAALAACLAPGAPALADTLAFEGRWDCGVGVFEFTSQSYRPGTAEPAMPIARVESDDGRFGLTFADGYRIGLDQVTPTTMTWSSSASGDVFECVRVEPPLRPLARSRIP